MSGRDLSLLEHIMRYCNQISTTIERFGDDQRIFTQDFIYQNAVALCLMQIGELVGHLSDEYKYAHPEMPWRQIKALRNIIAHDYGSVDAETAWEIIHGDIQDLYSYCMRECNSSSESNSDLK